MNKYRIADLKSMIYTIIILLLLYFLFLNIVWNIPQPIQPQYEYFDIALGVDPEGQAGVNDLQTAIPNQTETISTNTQNEKLVNNEGLENEQTIQQSNSEKINTDNSIPEDIPIKSSNNKKEAKATSALIPKAVLPKSNNTAFNNTNSSQTGLNQGNSLKNGIQGSPNGNPSGSENSSNSPFKIIKGDRLILKAETFKGNVPAATIYAKILVDKNGIGTFIEFDKNSSSYDQKYKTAIVNYLPKVKFNVTDHTSVVVLKFNFIVE